MCNEHRPTLAVTEMGGDKPKKTTSITLENVVLYRYLAAFVLTVITIFGIGFKAMTSAADSNFKERLHESLEAGGTLEVEIRRSINEGNHNLEKRLIRIETILLEMRGDK